MKTILHIIDSLARGGAERVVVNNINLFTDYNHVLCLLHQPLDLFDEIKQDIPLEVINFNSKTQIFYTIYRLRKIIRKHNPDIIHSHLLWSSWVARVAKPSDIPLVTTLHNCFSINAFEKNRFSKFIEQYTANKVDLFIAVSKTVRKDYLDNIKYLHEIYTVYNYNNIKDVSYSNLKYKIGEKLRIISVGNVREAKNHKFFIQAIANIPKEYLPKIQIDIYGAGKIDEKYGKIIEELQLPINFKGTEKNLKSKYAEYHIFCMPSIIEGMPMALLEAATARLPLLLSSIEIFKELADSKALFFSINTPLEFNEIIKKIIEGNIDLSVYQKYAHQLLEEWGKEKDYIDQHKSIYNKLLNIVD